MKLLKALVLLCLLLLTQQVLSQRAIRIEHVGLGKGLSQSMINAVAQDSDGYVWLATKDGLNRFDGYHCEVYRSDPQDSTSIHQNYITKVYCGASGRLFLTTEDGVIQYYDKAIDGFHRLEGWPIGQEDVRVSALYEDSEGQIWVLNAKGELWRRQSGDLKFDVIVPFDKVRTHKTSQIKEFSDKGIIMPINAHEIWISNDFLFNYQVNIHTGQWDYLHVELEPFDGNEVMPGTTTCPSGVYRPYDKDHVIFTWAGEVRGLYLVNLHTRKGKYLGKWKTFQTHPIADANGKIWFSGNNDLLYLVDPNGDGYEAVHVTDINGLKPEEMWLRFKDRTGAIWAYSGEGACYFNPDNAFDLYARDGNAPELSIKSFRSIAMDPLDAEKVWLTGYSGESVIHRKTGVDTKVQKWFDAYTPNQGVIFATERFGPDSLLMATDYDGVYSCRVGHGFSKVQVPFYAKATERTRRVVAMDPDGNGRVYVASDAGLHSIYLPTMEWSDHVTTYLTAGWEHPVTEVMVDPSGDVWGSGPHGVLRYDPETQEHEVFRPDGLDVDVLSILWRADELWLGTKGQGIWRMDPSNGQLLGRIDASQGMVDPVIYGMLEAENGDVFFSTNKGLGQWMVSNQRVRTFGEESPLQNLEFNSWSFNKAQDGRMYFGGIDGVTSFHPSQLSERAPRLNIRLNNLTIAGVQAMISDHMQTGGLELQPHQRTFSLEFTTSDYVGAANREFAYRIASLDSAWIPLNTRREISFTNLQHGVYKVEMRATNRMGFWEEMAAPLRVDMVPIWYEQTWVWFAGAGFVLMLVLGFFLLRIRTVKLQREKLALEVRRQTEEIVEQKAQLEDSLQEKEVLLKEIHHRVKNNMQMVSSLLNLQSMRVNDETVKGAIEEGKNRVKSMALIHQNLYQEEHVGVINFEEYISQLIGHLVTSYGQQNEPKVHLDTGGITLDIDTAVPLGLIVNELVTNSFKYGLKDLEEPCLSIILMAQDERKVRLSVSDNGPGMPEGFSLTEARSLGLRLVSQLTRQLYGKAHFENTASGCRFDIDFLTKEARLEYE